MNSMPESHGTFKKSVWTPPVSVQNLLEKVEQVEARLAHLEMLIGSHIDPVLREQEQQEVDQSRRELEDMRHKLDQALQRLQHREAELQQTQVQVDNLTNQTAADRRRLGNLEADKKELQQLVQELESRLNERVKKVARLEKQVAEMKQSLANTNSQVAELSAQMAEMRLQMAAFALASPRSPEDSSPSPATKRRHAGSLGLPPLPLPPQQQQGRVSRAAMNFPPGKPQ